MKIALVTTSWLNPGDQFIRLGIQYLVRQIHPNADFLLVNKEDSLTWNNLDEADHVIWCGMPLFWSFPTHHSQGIFWWDGLLRRIFKQRPNKLIVLGAGTAGKVSEKQEEAFTRPDEVRWAYDDVLKNSSVLTLRDDCIQILFPDLPKSTVLPCPSIFCAEEVKPVDHDLICNLMPACGHYEELYPGIKRSWSAMLHPLARFLQIKNAFFIAHNSIECQLARDLGWLPDKISFGQEIIPHIKGASTYFGNRVHGSIVASSYGADSYCLGYDLRLRASELCGVTPIHVYTQNPFPSCDRFDKGLTSAKYLDILRKHLV